MLLPVAALVVGGLAIAFCEITGQSADAVLFSGQQAFGSLTKQGATLFIGTLAFLVLFKGLAWSISLGNFRATRHFQPYSSAPLRGCSPRTYRDCPETPAVAVVMGAAAVSILKLPRRQPSSPCC